MPKREEPCMFCGMAPCECNKKASPVVHAPVQQEIAQVVAPPTGVYSNEMITGPQDLGKKKDLVMAHAVEVFIAAGMVDEEERARLSLQYSATINPKVRTNLKEWKERNVSPSTDK